MTDSGWDILDTGDTVRFAPEGARFGVTGGNLLGPGESVTEIDMARDWVEHHKAMPEGPLKDLDGAILLAVLEGLKKEPD